MEETLLTAARRAVRFFNIDQAHGGLLSRDTEMAMHTLDKEVQKETARQKAAEAAKKAEAEKE